MIMKKHKIHSLKFYLSVLKSSIFHSVFIILSFTALGQKVDAERKDTIYFFENTKDFFNNKYSNVKGSPVFIDKNDTFVHLSDVMDIKNGVKLKQWRQYWGIEYKGKKYFHLGYMDDASIDGIYMTFNIIGKYSAILLNSQTSKYVWNYRVHYGGSIQSVLMSESLVWGTNWLDERKNNNRIIILDTADLSKQTIDNSYYTSYYLHKNQLKKMIKRKYPNINIKDVSFEKAIEYILEMNKEQ